MGGEEGGGLSGIAVGKNFYQISPGEVDAGTGPEESECLWGRKAATAGSASTGSEGRVDAVNVESEVNGVSALLFNELLEAGSGFRRGCGGGGDDLDAVVFGVVKIGSAIERSSDSDGEHFPGINQAAFYGADEWRGMRPFFAPDGIDSVEMGVEME